MVVVVVGGIVLHLVKREMELSRRGNVRGDYVQGETVRIPFVKEVEITFA